MRAVGVVVLVLVLALSTAAPVGAQTSEATDCWTETSIGSAGEEVKVTVCLVSGELEIYTSGSEPPPMIDVNLGYDYLGTECWWATAYDTGWVELDRYPDGSIRVGYHPEGSSETVLDAIVRGCEGQPVETENTLSQAWELATKHIHEPPTPGFNPGTGITGFETYIAVEVPDPITDSLTSPLGTVVEVEIKVGTVVVDWGDGETDNYTESFFSLLTGWPSGNATHVYETKTCPPPGGPYCHESPYPITVEFDWFVQWRVNGGPWSPIAVPNTVETVDYDVGEIVTRSVPNP